jgi:hypothetical protein
MFAVHEIGQWNSALGNWPPMDLHSPLTDTRMERGGMDGWTARGGEAGCEIAHQQQWAIYWVLFPVRSLHFYPIIIII